MSPTHTTQTDALSRWRIAVLNLPPNQNERVTLTSNPGKVLIVIPLQDGHVIDAWYDRCPAPFDSTSSGAVHVFELRYTWSVMFSSGFKAIALEVPCDVLAASGFRPTTRPSAAENQSKAALGIVSGLTHAAAALLCFDDPAHDTVIQNLVQALVGNLQLGLCECRMYPRPSGERLAAWQEQRIRTYIASNLTAKIRASEVSRSCGISSSHFSRLFKNTVGVTLHQWVVNQRIDEAKRLLLKTNAAISEIASVTGFADQAHFSRVFSRNTQATPMAWRRVRRA
jgi:AraC-like DNA-binding protein